MGTHIKRVYGGAGKALQFDLKSLWISRKNGTKGFNVLYSTKELTKIHLEQGITNVDRVLGAGYLANNLSSSSNLQKSARFSV